MGVKAGRYTANYPEGLLLSGVGVGSAFNQALRQIGGIPGVALSILLLGKDVLSRADFVLVYSIHIGLALLAGLLCSAIQTRPAPQPLAAAPSAPALPGST